MLQGRMSYQSSKLNSFYPSAFGCKGYCHDHDGRADGRRADTSLSAPKLSSYGIKPLKINIVCRCAIEVVQGKVILLKKMILS